MSKLPVKLLKIFGGGLSPGGNVAQFGSLAAGSPAYSSDPAVLQALAAWANGMVPALIDTGGGQSSPTLEDFNGILLVLTYQLAYLKQQGVAEWDPTVTYFEKSIAMDPATGALYVSRTDNNTNNAVTDATNWQTYASTLLGSSSPLLKAWVVFDGRSGAVDSSFNVANVTRTSAGVYLVTFAAAMADAFYGFSGSAGTRPLVGFLPGDNNTICGGVSGRTIVRTAAQCTIFNYDPRIDSLEDSGMISVQFFGNP